MEPKDPIAEAGASATVEATQPDSSPKEEAPARKRYVTPEQTKLNNKALQEAYAKFIHKQVRTADGQEGTVIGVDPRPVRGGPDGCYLIIRTTKQATLPGRFPHNTTYALAESVTLVPDAK